MKTPTHNEDENCLAPAIASAAEEVLKSALGKSLMRRAAEAGVGPMIALLVLAWFGYVGWPQMRADQQTSLARVCDTFASEQAAARVMQEREESRLDRAVEALNTAVDIVKHR